MEDNVELRHIRYLLAVIAQMGFRAAAEFLHTVQPNVSNHYKQFLDATGVHLFRQLPNGRIRVTEAGHAFEVMARDLLEAHHEMLSALVSIEHGEVRSLRFGCGPFVDAKLFRLACDIHREMVPGCQLWPMRSDSVQVAREVAAGKIDMALVAAPITDSNLHVEPIWRDPWLVCLPASHPLAGQSAIRPDQLRNNLSVLIDPQRHPAVHAILMQHLEEAGIRLQEYSRASHPLEIQQMVKEGYGFALVSDGMELDSTLTTRPIVGVDWALETAFVLNRQRHPKTVPVLLRLLKRRLAAMAQPGHLPQSNQRKDPGRQPPPASQGPVQLSLLG